MTEVARKVLVTGARGFIGRRCLPLLAARGFEVHAVSSSGWRMPGPATWHRCDLLDPAQAELLVERVRASHLLHLAWIATPGLFWASPSNLEWLDAGVRLVDKFYRAGGIRAVGAGTCAEYGMTGSPFAEERSALAPDSVYGETKAAMYFALRAASRGRGTWAWARLFFPYGPGEPPSRFIPALIDGLLAGKMVDCTHGRQVRDFVHADDVAEACATLVDCTVSGAYNVGSGEGASLREVADLVIAELGHRELVRFGQRPAPAHDPAHVVADPCMPLRGLAWAPRISLAEGIRRTIAARRASILGVS